jgi:hypothetical protein
MRILAKLAFIIGGLLFLAIVFVICGAVVQYVKPPIISRSVMVSNSSYPPPIIQ